LYIRKYSEILNNVIYHLELKILSIFKQTNYNELKRLVLMIMIKLNDFGLEYCTPPNSNFLLFNNIHVNKTTLFSTLNKDIIKLSFTQYQYNGHEVLQYSNINNLFINYKKIEIKLNSKIT